MRWRAIYYSLKYGLLPWWLYEDEPHYAGMTYRAHLAMNLRQAGRWLVGRESEEDRDFEEAVNGG